MEAAEPGPAREGAVSLVVPVFREAENLAALAGRIRDAMSAAGLEWELVLVDDDSGDGSEAVAEELARDLPIRMEVRRDPPRDLSLSVLRGFRIARHDRLVVMDADLSHPPERIPDLLAALDTHGDMAVGSRYVPGGEIDRDWSAWRRLNSRLAGWLARPLTACSDPMSGFFALDRRALPEPETLRPIGYKIGLELMVRGRLRVVEVPIDFADRERGASKLNWRQRLNYLRHLQRLYLHRFGGWVRALSFGLVGASGLAIDVAGYFALQWAGLEHRLARFLSFWPAVSWNWWLNRGFTFGERPLQPAPRQWAKFVASSLIGLGTNVGSYTLLTSFVAVFDRHRWAALLCGVALGSAFNYFASTLYVYSRQMERRRSG
ncbi:MAG: glycosyltransferase family 2 protein [Proteobacteria bacterium]|nr:glycosyltransferase family 2 protein [Pseudomonadota bacterium]